MGSTCCEGWEERKRETEREGDRDQGTETCKQQAMEKRD